MADEGHDARDEAALCRRGTGKDAEVGVADEVTRATDTVHHLRAADVGRVGVAIDVALDGGIDGDDTLRTAGTGTCLVEKDEG